MLSPQSLQRVNSSDVSLWLKSTNDGRYKKQRMVSQSACLSEYTAEQYPHSLSSSSTFTVDAIPSPLSEQATYTAHQASACSPHRDRAGFTIPPDYLISTNVGLVPREKAFFLLTLGHTLFDWSVKSRTRFAEVTVESLESSALGSRGLSAAEQRLQLWRTIPRSHLYDDGIIVRGGRRKWLTKKEWKKEMVSQPGIGLTGCAKDSASMTQRPDNEMNAQTYVGLPLTSLLIENDGDISMEYYRGTDSSRHGGVSYSGTQASHKSKVSSKCQCVNLAAVAGHYQFSTEPYIQPLSTVNLQHSSAKKVNTETRSITSFISSLVDVDGPVQNEAPYEDFLSSWKRLYRPVRSQRRRQSV